MEEKKKRKKAWKIAAGIIGAVLIAAIIYCMAAAMMPLGRAAYEFIMWATIIKRLPIR